MAEILQNCFHFNTLLYATIQAVATKFGWMTRRPTLDTIHALKFFFFQI